MRAGGRWLENCVVKSISVLSSKLGPRRTRLMSVVDEGECGRLKVWSEGSSAMLLISKASSMHWHLVSSLHLPQVMGICAMASVCRWDESFDSC